MKSSGYVRISRRPTVLLPSVTMVDDFCVNTLNALHNNLSFDCELAYGFKVRGYDFIKCCLRYTLIFYVNRVPFYINAFVSTKVRDIKYPQIHCPYSLLNLILEINNHFKV